MTRYPVDAGGRYLRELLGVDFTPAQLEIITHPLRPQLVVAGAGAGKTTVMAARVVHAVAAFGLAPSSILGLTFTNKAAAELAARVRTALARLAPASFASIPGTFAADEPGVAAGRPAPNREQPGGGPGSGGRADEPPGGHAGSDEPLVATYHAYAAALVRDHALRIGREPLTELLPEPGRWQLATRVVRAARIGFAHLPWTAATVARYLLALDSEIAEHGRSVEDVRRFDADLLDELLADGGAGSPGSGSKVQKCAEAARARDELLTLVAAYRAEKEDRDLLDHGDQVALAAEIAQRAPEVGRMERARFGLVLLDEYQDTGVAQRELLAALFGRDCAVTAVGDPHQAIYGWRGASVGNLLRFPEHFAAGRRPPLPQPLMTSFRCGGRILAVANAVAEPLSSSPAAARRPRLAVPPLGPSDGRETDGETVVALHETVADEADWVAETLAAEIAAGVAPRECAVLCRQRRMFARLHAALVARGLPVEVVGLGGLLDMPEVADVVATLRVLVDPTANGAVLRLLTGPRWRIGPRDLAVLGRRATALASYDDPAAADPVVAAAQRVDPVEVASLLEAVDSPGDAAAYSPAAWQRLAAFRSEIRELRPLVGQPIVEIVAEVVNRTGLDVEIEAAPTQVAAARAANLAAFLDAAAHFPNLEGGSDLLAFLAFLDAAADVDNGLDVGGVSGADTVKLLTVHKAKGLEWDVVAVPGLARDVFPSSQTRSRWTSAAGVLPFPLRGDAVDLPPKPEWTNAALEAFASACRDDENDEERRLGYVAFTRARRRLLLSGYWWGETQTQPKGPSVLLSEVHGLVAKGLAVEGPWLLDEDAAEANPLLGALRRDVEWPRPYQPAAREQRERAAAEVAAARLRGAPATDVAEPGLDPEAAGRVATWRAEAAVLVDELRQARAGRRAVALPRRLTTTQIVALGADAAGLARSLARPLPARPLRQAREGTRFHEWVESFYGQRPLLRPEEMPGAADDALDGVEAGLEELRTAFLASAYAERVPVAVEAPFELLVGGRLVRGRIDAIYPSDGGFEVIDFKTGEVPRDFAAASLQLSVYRLAWADIAGVDPRRVTAGFLYVRTGLVKRPDRLLDRAELAALLSVDPPG